MSTDKWYTRAIRWFSKQGPPEGGGQPPGQGPGGEGPPGPGGEGPPGPGGEGPPGQGGNGNGNGENPGDGPPIPDGNASLFPPAVDWASIYGVPWNENWYQDDYVIDVVLGEGEPPQDHYEPRHVPGEIHAEIEARYTSIGTTLEGYWELLAKTHQAMESHMDEERPGGHEQQRFLRPKSERSPVTYSGCLNCMGTEGCDAVHDLATQTMGDTSRVAAVIAPMLLDELNALMDDMHRYLTCIRADMWAHDRAEHGEPMEKDLPSVDQVHVQKPYTTLESLPDAVKKLPKHGQEIYRAAFNAAYTEYGESRAHAIAWAAVKTKYEQRDGAWVAKGERWFTWPETVGGVPNENGPWVQFSTYPNAPWVQLDRHVPFAKVDEEKRLVYMVVMEPGDAEHVDTQGDFTTEEEIEAACHDFMEKYRLGEAGLGLQHERTLEGHIKQSYIAPQKLEMGSQVVAKGSWVMVAYIAEDEVWKAVKSGELDGASIGGVGQRTPAE